MSILNYLQTIKPEELDSLYENKWACKAIFRSLSELSKQYLMQYLFSYENIKISNLTSSLLNNVEALEQHSKSIQELVKLRIFL